MGPVGSELVVATFYNFNPEVIYQSIPSAWQVASPEDVQAARFRAGGQVLHSACGDVDDAVIARATEIAQAMIDAVGDEGKPLAASNRAVALPDDPMIRLWQLITVVREWRGDAHLAALGAAAVDGIEALVLHAAMGTVPAQGLQATRAWSDESWSAAIARLVARGLVDDTGTFTKIGAAFRADIEAATNGAAQSLVTAVGEDAASELCDLLKPIRSALLESGAADGPSAGSSSRVLAAPVVGEDTNPQPIQNPLRCDTPRDLRQFMQNHRNALPRFSSTRCWYSPSIS